MKITLEPTGRFERVNGVLCRVWTGETEQGTEIHTYVAMTAVRADGPDIAAFDAALRAIEPERQAVTFDNRFVV